ncbi:glycosyltransferase family 4 protein [Crocinitomix catalasitica]|nr:glycosyltransferase family 4 protein [Crocinitomix catalasitica]
MKETKPKLLLVGSTHGSVHLRNYYHLIKDYFDDILTLTTQEVDFCRNEVINFSLKNPFNTRKSIKRIRQIIREENPDIIHVHQANACGYVTAKANNGIKPLILTSWGSDVLLMPAKGFLYRKTVQYAIKSADVITADAVYMADAISKLGTESKVVIANFGIDYEEIQIPSKENIIYSNRLHFPLYQIDKIIRAYADFQKQHPDWKLILGARGESSDELKTLAKDLLQKGSYEFIGFVEMDVNQSYYLKSRIYISIPESDGTSISLLEAMGYGCIPVVSNLPANKEWIEDDVNGCLVRDSAAEALERALTLNLENVQKKNIEIVETKATKKVNRKIFYGIYDEFLSV